MNLFLANGIKNRFLTAACQLLARSRASKVEPEKILVVSTTALGDTLWATPALAALRKTFPQSSIAALTSPVGREVLDNNPALNRIYSFEEPLLPKFFSLLRLLKAERFDTILIFHTSQRLILPLCTLLGASRIVGTTGINKGLDALLTDPLPPRRQHEIERRLDIVRHIGAQVQTRVPAVFLRDEETALPAAFHPWVALHPGAKDIFKRWPAAHFIAVGRRLQAETNAQILVTGTKSEEPLMREVASQIPKATLSDPTLSLRQFAALLSQIDLLISNDTGPAHLACALNRPAIAIHSSTDPFLCGPYQAPLAHALFHPPTCAPCLRRKCRRPFCFLQITPDEVFKTALEALKTKKKFYIKK